MNILMLNWRDPKNPKSGGAEHVTLKHCRAWIKAGHKVTWFTSKFPACKDEEVLDGIKIIRRGNPIGIYFLAPFYYLFSGNRFDFVVDQIHGFPFFTPIYVRKPKIAFIHEVAGKIWDSMYPFPVSTIGKSFEKILFSIYKSTQFMTVSDSTKKSLIDLGVKKGNIHVVLNGIDVVRSRFPKENINTFIFVSRVVKMKGIEDVIRAFFYILRKNKKSQLWIVGDGEKKYVNELKKIMRDFSISPKVKFFGRVSEKKKIELLRRSHILLHASVKEGWGLVVIEAASQETPAVVYNVLGLKDSVINNKTGIVLKENNSEEMAKEALSLIKDRNKYRIMQRNCLSWANSLSWKDSTSQSLNLINMISKNG